MFTALFLNLKTWNYLQKVQLEMVTKVNFEVKMMSC
jgi:hypothetical protein